MLAFILDRRKGGLAPSKDCAPLSFKLAVGFFQPIDQLVQLPIRQLLGIALFCKSINFRETVGDIAGEAGGEFVDPFFVSGHCSYLQTVFPSWDVLF